MQTKPDKNSPPRHGGSIPLTRYARRNGKSVEKNVEGTPRPRHYWHQFYLGRTRSCHEQSVALDIIRRVKWALRPPRIIWPVFFCVAFAFSCEAGSHRSRPTQNQSIYQRAVNVTLDTVMWVHEQHAGRMTWNELNSEVCRQMKVQRIEPWAKR